MSFRGIIESVNGARRTLSLVNVDAPPDVTAAVADYVDPLQVRLVRDRTESGQPTNAALFHADGDFLAASPLRTVYRHVDVERGLHTATDLESFSYPAVLAGIDDTTFSEFGKRRMIVASREIEKRAWDADAGALHVGFQRLSLLADQRRIYRKLGDSGVDTHVYGEPDASAPADVPVAVHPSDDPEIRDCWFVVFDGAGAADRKAALLAEDLAPNRYSGFWTHRSELVDRVLEHLQAEHLPAG
ncbi:MAG: DICT sensory domain-containing protein [Haloarculaceae archaeon]